MTEKKEKILSAALDLFAEEGYKATPTSKVAKAAEVSEGLIFRHFGNKEGLLQAILEKGEQKAKELFSEILTEKDPQAVIRKTLKLPFSVASGDHAFWKLQYKLKWEIEYSSKSYMEVVFKSIAHAFAELGYEKPETEAQFVMIIIDGLATAILKKELEETEELRQLVLNKYHL